MKAILLQEPELEFGTGRHVDIRFGLMAHGPVDFENSPASRIRAGIVGSPESIEGVANWIGKCRGEIEAKASNYPYLFPKFPGCNQDTNLKFTVEVGTTSFREVLDSQIEPLLKNPSRAVAVESVAKLFLAEIEYLASSQKVQVIICAPPMLLFKFLAEESGVEFKESGAKGDSSEAPDFHDWLKARAMNAGVPIQVVWPSTYDETKSLPKTRGRKDKRQLQDEATRAWNFHLALYYKAGGVPWRMSRSATDMTTLYVGVSFYRALEKTRLQTSMAQVFNERGEGVIVRGGTAKLCKDDMQVHLDSASANQLMDGALSQYKREHFTMPARIVLHKTSSFDAAEIEGFKSAITKHSIHSADLLYVSHADTRAFRDGVYPPLRGTYINLEDHLHLLYTRGSVEFFNVYPGMYVPRPLRFRSDHLSQSAVFAAQELLALTKMNWNNTQFDGLEPITIRAARQVGSILKYIDDPRLPYQSRYSFYM